MEITCHKDHITRLEESGFCIDEENDSDYLDHVCLLCYERNYADTEKLPKDIPYWGAHGSGGCYGSGLFVCDGYDFVYVNNLQDVNYPVVKLDIDGKLDKYDLKIGRQYLRMLKTVRERIEHLSTQ